MRPYNEWIDRAKSVYKFSSSPITITEIARKSIEWVEIKIFEETLKAQN